MEFKDVSDAEFNSGLAIIYQLDAIEKFMILATVNPNEVKRINEHFKYLFSYFKTLYPYMSEEEKTKQKQRWKDIKKNLENINKQISLGQNSINTDMIESFDLWELELRELKQKHGLGMPKRDMRYQPVRGR